MWQGFSILGGKKIIALYICSLECKVIGEVKDPFPKGWRSYLGVAAMQSENSDVIADQSGSFNWQSIG